MRVITVQCDMCGAETKLSYALVEGTKIRVCKQCGKYGKIISPVRQPRPVEKKEDYFAEKPRKEVLQLITKNYASKIRKKREQMGPSPHILNFLNNGYHLLFRFSHAGHKMRSCIARSEDLNGLGKSCHISFPLVRPPGVAVARQHRHLPRTASTRPTRRPA